MPRKARIHFETLQSSLVKLPVSLYGPLVQKEIRPQSLAIHLKLISSAQLENTPKVEVVVGWTGMASASSLASFNASQTEMSSDTIEIDPQYAQALGLGHGDIVEVGLLYDLPFAKSVGAEPLTSDDWEIIEIHASHVESILLSQVRVAKIGQEMDVWVLGRTRVRLRVVSLELATKGDIQLLTTDTEVSISPKLHQNQQSVFGKQSTEIAGNKQPSPNKPAREGHSIVLRVIPKRLFPILIPDRTGPDIVTYVSPRTFARLVPEYKVERCPMGKLRRLNPPPNPSSSVAPEAATVPPTLDSNTQSKEGKGGDEITNAGFVYVSPVNGIVDGHIFIPMPYQSIEEWDLVCLTSLSDDANNGSGPLLAETEAVASSRPAAEQSSSLAGVDDILEECVNFCRTSFVLHSLTNDVRGVTGVLVTGRPGAGKSSIVQTIAKALQEDQQTLTYIHYEDVSRYSEQPVSKVHEMFKFWFEKAAWHRPAVLILDNLDKLLSAEVEYRSSFRSRQLTELFLHIYSPAARATPHNFRGILLLATATSKNDLHALVNSSHIFKEVVNLLPPSKQARRDILTKVVQERLRTAQDIQEDPEMPLNFTTLAIRTEGYSALDLRDLVARAFHQVAIRLASGSESAYLTAADFATAQVDFVPLSLRDVRLQKSEISWSDIGGLHEARRILRETLEWPTKYAPIFAQSPLRLRSGLLLYGYPGCGKTLLASAVAKECGLNFISVKGPEILNKYIGASEKSVRDLFERATAAKPCVLFFDEFDSIAPKRGHDSTGVTDRVVNQMLTQMDGAEGLEGVYVLAATSRPDLIDPALLRPGRLDKSLLCGMPNLEERADILAAISKKVSISPSVNFQEVAAATDGYSGADLQALLYNAHLEVVHQTIATESPSMTSTAHSGEEPIKYVAFGGPPANSKRSKAEEMDLQKRLRQIKNTLEPSAEQNAKSTAGFTKKREIGEDHIRKVLETTRPSVAPGERRRLERIYKAFVSNRSGGLPVPPDNEASCIKITSTSKPSGTKANVTSSKIVDSLEALVIAFMAQLVAQPCEDKERSEDDGKNLKNRIRLQLANRRHPSPSSIKHIIYPRKAVGGSARSLAQLFRVLDINHDAIIGDMPVTKREIFYRDVALFRSQRVVDMRASSKGLVCGEGLAIKLRSGGDIIVHDSEGTLIPAPEDVESYSITGNIRWVLVVEKEAVFDALCRLRLVKHPALSGRGFLITGKGYPDLATRYFLKFLANTLSLSVPFLALMDGDPHGLEILSVYKYGSQSQWHEKDNLAVERIMGLGLWTTIIHESAWFSL
ncbi:hypothetical protein AX17_005746 [Amanita inopinata Kibby_2008]|nr:hypothetical protein AX17_005746 [Amanita inopinata Kibby_2008]